jgi:hypothetical protein
MHIYPRFENDGFDENCSTIRVAAPEERKQFSSAMRGYFSRRMI